METVGFLYSLHSVYCVLLFYLNRFSILSCLQQTRPIIQNRRFHQSKKQGWNNRLRCRKSPSQMLVTSSANQNLPGIIRKPRIMHIRTAEHRISLQLLRCDHIKHHAARVHQRLLHRSSSEQVHSIARSRVVQAIAALAADRQLGLRVFHLASLPKPAKTPAECAAAPTSSGTNSLPYRNPRAADCRAKNSARRRSAAALEGFRSRFAFAASQFRSQRYIKRVAIAENAQCCLLYVTLLVQPHRKSAFFVPIPLYTRRIAASLRNKHGQDSSICAHCCENTSISEAPSSRCGCRENGKSRTLPSVARSRFREYFSTSQG